MPLLRAARHEAVCRHSGTRAVCAARCCLVRRESAARVAVVRAAADVAGPSSANSLFRSGNFWRVSTIKLGDGRRARASRAERPRTGAAAWHMENSRLFALPNRTPLHYRGIIASAPGRSEYVRQRRAVTPTCEAAPAPAAVASGVPATASAADAEPPMAADIWADAIAFCEEAKKMEEATAEPSSRGSSPVAGRAATVASALKPQGSYAPSVAESLDDRAESCESKRLRWGCTNAGCTKRLRDLCVSWTLLAQWCLFPSPGACLLRSENMLDHIKKCEMRSRIAQSVHR